MPAGANVDLGNIYSITELSAGSLNADLLSAMDVSSWDWFSIYIGGSAYSGQLSAQGTNDPDDASSWQTLQMFFLDTLSIPNIVIDSLTYVGRGGPRRYPFLRIRMTSYTSGTAVGSVELRRGISAMSLAASYSILLNSSFNVGFINNDGTQNAVVASGHAADTVIKASSGMLASVLVTATNTHEMDIYDNASAGSGTLIGVIPANTPVDGVPFVLRAPATNGITVKGNGSNPGVTIFFA